MVARTGFNRRGQESARGRQRGLEGTNTPTPSDLEASYNMMPCLTAVAKHVASSPRTKAIGARVTCVWRTKPELHDRATLIVEGIQTLGLQRLVFDTDTWMVIHLLRLLAHRKNQPGTIGSRITQLER